MVALVNDLLVDYLVDGDHVTRCAVFSFGIKPNLSIKAVRSVGDSVVNMYKITCADVSAHFGTARE